MALSAGAQALKDYVITGTPYGGDSSGDDAYIERTYATAVALVATDLGGDIFNVPVEVLDRVHLLVGADLFHMRGTKNGVSQFASPDAGAIRIGRDPLQAARPILAPYRMSWGIA